MFSKLLLLPLLFSSAVLVDGRDKTGCEDIAVYGFPDHYRPSFIVQDAAAMVDNKISTVYASTQTVLTWPATQLAYNSFKTDPPVTVDYLFAGAANATAVYGYSPKQSNFYYSTSTIFKCFVALLIINNIAKNIRADKRQRDSLNRIIERIPGTEAAVLQILSSRLLPPCQFPKICHGS